MPLLAYNQIQHHLLPLDNTRPAFRSHPKEHGNRVVEFLILLNSGKFNYRAFCANT